MTLNATNTDAEITKGRRVTVDLTPAAAAEVDRLKAITGLKTADIFRHSMTLFRIYIDAKEHDEELRVINPASSGVQTRIELPVSVASRA